ncbi:MAG: hypothetical protein WEB57_02805 [Pseudohongiellaceae bacterium]
MSEQWMNPAIWGGAQWLVAAILVLVVLALAVVIHRLISVVRSEMTRKRERPVLRPSLRPDLYPPQEGEGREAAGEKPTPSPDRDQ